MKSLMMRLGGSNSSLNKKPNLLERRMSKRSSQIDSTEDKKAAVIAKTETTFTVSLGANSPSKLESPLLYQLRSRLMSCGHQIEIFKEC